MGATAARHMEGNGDGAVGGALRSHAWCDLTRSYVLMFVLVVLCLSLCLGMAVSGWASQGPMEAGGQGLWQAEGQLLPEGWVQGWGGCDAQLRNRLENTIYAVCNNSATFKRAMISGGFWNFVFSVIFGREPRSSDTYYNRSHERPCWILRNPFSCNYHAFCYLALLASYRREEPTAFALFARLSRASCPLQSY